MTATSASPYRLLGLEPGAERSAVDAAYRSLMKRHHPDRGGDPQVAAEINRAYAALTRPEQAIAVEPVERDLAAALYARRVAAKADRQASRNQRARWPLWLLLGIALVGGVGWFQREAVADLVWQLRWTLFQPSASPAGREEGSNFVPEAPTRLDQAPIARQDILDALADARAGLQRGGLGRAADMSSLCYQQFVAAPTLRAYDRCVAFDDSVLLLAGANAVDRGVFSAASLTARQLAAGRILGADYDAIEYRLDRIRIRTLHEIQPPMVAR